MVTIKISYQLTENGQRAAMLAGGDGKKNQFVECECTPEALALAEISGDGNVSINMRWARIDGINKFTSHESDVLLTACEAVASYKELVSKLLDDQKCDAVALAAERENNVQMVLTAPLDDLITMFGRYRWTTAWLIDAVRDDNRIADRLREVQEVCAARNDAINAAEERKDVENRAIRDAEETEKIRKALAKTEAVGLWATTIASAETRERFVAGYLPEIEALDAIKEIVFAPLRDFPLYARITNRQLPDSDCCIDDHALAVDTIIDELRLSADQFAQLKKVRSVVGENGRVIPRLHRATCAHDDCESTIDRYGVLVRIEWKGITVSREYALPITDGE